MSPSALRSASPDHDFACHLRMNAAVVGICSRLCKGVRELLIRIQCLGFKYAVIACDHVWDVVLIYPGDSGIHRNCECIRTKCKVVDSHFRSRSLAVCSLRPRWIQHQRGRDRKQGGENRVSKKALFHMLFSSKMNSVPFYCYARDESTTARACLPC